MVFTSSRRVTMGNLASPFGLIFYLLSQEGVYEVVPRLGRQRELRHMRLKQDIAMPTVEHRT
jgi:hypothetical protein